MLKTDSKIRIILTQYVFNKVSIDCRSIKPVLKNSDTYQCCTKFLKSEANCVTSFLI